MNLDTQPLGYPVSMTKIPPALVDYFLDHLNIGTISIPPLDDWLVDSFHVRTQSPRCSEHPYRRYTIYGSNYWIIAFNPLLGVFHFRRYVIHVHTPAPHSY